LDLTFMKGLRTDESVYLKMSISDTDSSYDSDSGYYSYLSHDTDSSCDSSWAHRSSFNEDFKKICVRDENGKIHGLYEEKDDYGTVRTRCNYIHGRIEGLYQEWHSNRRLSLECNYEKGRRNGFCYTWHRNRALASRSFYVDGFERGVTYYWNRKGVLERQENNGCRKCVIDFQTWMDDGSIMRIDYNKSGKLGIYLHWHENGQLRDQMSYKAGQPDGWDIQWTEDGKIEKKEIRRPYVYKPSYGENIRIEDVDVLAWDVNE
jgi:antitoxin component YwqK of YwqJK toxin-antitoxin module